MTGRSLRSEPKRLSDKYDILLTPVVVSLRKLREGTIGNNLSEKMSCEDESVCDDRSISQDPGWQKDVSDVLTSILKDGSTCAPEWGGDTDQTCLDLPRLDTDKEKLTTYKINPPNPEADETTNIDDCADDSGSDATITDITENMEGLKELESTTTIQEVPSNSPKSPILDVCDVTNAEWAEEGYQEKSKVRKVSSLSVYADVEDGIIKNVSCKRFKRRCKKIVDDSESYSYRPVKYGRRKKSFGYTGDETDDVIENEVKDLVEDMVFKASYNVIRLKNLSNWSEEKEIVGGLLKEFCECNGYDYDDYDNPVCILDFDSHIVKESDIINIPSQRKCYKRKFPQELEGMFRKRRKRKLTRGEVVKKFFTRSAARRLKYKTTKNGDTIVVEESDSNTDSEIVEKSKDEIVKEIPSKTNESPSTSAATVATSITTITTDTTVSTVTTATKEQKLNILSKKSTTNDIESKEAVKSEDKSKSQQIILERKSPVNITQETEENTVDHKVKPKDNDDLEIKKAYGISKFRHKHHILQSLKKNKVTIDTDAPLDLRIKDGGSDNSSTGKLKTPIQMVHPQVNTSLMPKKVWCARRNLDCFTNGENFSLVNNKVTTDVNKISPISTPKPEVISSDTKKAQESEAESILRSLLLEASDAAVTEISSEAKRNAEASLNVPKVLSVSDKDHTKTPDHRDTINRMKEVLSHATPRLKSSPAPPVDIAMKKPNENESISEADKFQDPLQIKEEIKKLKNEIIHLEMIAEQKEKERVAIICFKKCKEEILKQIENSQFNTLLQKDGCGDKDSKTQPVVHSKLSLHALYNYAKNKMINAHRQNSIYHANHRETCMVRPIVSHDNRKSPLGNESLPSVEALVAKASENYGVSFDHLSDDKNGSLNRQSLEHNRRLSELQHSAYQCCTDPLWRNATLYGFAPSSGYCNSFHTPLALSTKLSIDHEQDSHLKGWKYGAISDYSNKERNNDKKDDRIKTEMSRENKVLYHPTATVPPVTWSERTYCKPNGTITTKTSESSSRLTPITPTTSPYIGSALGRYESMDLSQSFYSSPNFPLSMSCWNGYPAPQLPRHSNDTESSSKVRNENQRWMDRPCPTYHSLYIQPRGNSTSPC
ncbi:uncharacterized protein LOC111639807 [Centruroides sculpturatus]|uniref:uncharacterized protein LOC111639804 n=1 Tax=Centruroides sculpturatus TaxID=218467 RepID=UPI000C6DF62A|nr:uncharacterized protein LOC111639804 [Centruroides sculpturatus]XP_023241522.1 uncharacterized protein LOC111639807 [Centruroides sculpturatus]